AALCLREGGSLPHPAVSFGGEDRLVRGLVEGEFLAPVLTQGPGVLWRTAALELMSGPLCDSVLERSGSAGTLAHLARSNGLLVPLDRRGQWYRYHHLFRDILLPGFGGLGAPPGAR